MAISEQLREAILASKATHYRIALDTGLSPIAISRFVTRDRPYLRSDTMDRLCDYFGLALAPIAASGKNGKAGKSAAGKQRRNRPERAVKDGPGRGAKARPSGGQARRGDGPKRHAPVY
jgi:hypothetical protein